MTRDELKDLACLGFSADLVMQSFCHTAAYPKPIDVAMQHSLPDFIMNRGGVALRPSTDSGISSGMTPVAAAKATKPEPAGNEIPIGKRVRKKARKTYFQGAY
jgi:hypothetical protein